MKREEVLQGVTYKLKLDHLESSIYVTINHKMVKGVPVPYELFINSKDSEVFAWSVPTARLTSAILRQEGDIAFLIEELQTLFGAESFYYKGKKRYSIISIIGELLEHHSENVIKGETK